MDPVAAYDALLENDAVASETCETLHERQCAQGLAFGDRPLSVVLRPQLIDRARYRAAVESSEALFGALHALEDALLRDGELRRELDLHPEEERLILADPGYRPSVAFARLDGFYSDRLRFIECNPESPAGMAWADRLRPVFDELPVMREFRRRFRVRGQPIRPRLLSSLLRAFRQWGGAETPVVAIVDWAGVPTISEFEMFRDYFQEQGIRTLICDPRELEVRRGALYAGGERVNLVYRRVLANDVLAHPEETRALREAYLSGAACVVNNFRCKLLTKKTSLALLADERYAHLYTRAQRDAIAGHVPWTRKVREGPGTRDGERIPDLMAHLAAHREELVIKPSDEYGGKGVVLGWTVDQTEWEQALAVAATESYVVQEAVPVPREAFPVSAGGVKFIDMSVDTNPFLFNGKMSGSLTRLSSTALLNVTAGAGSIVPTYLVEGPRG
jgi:uncharacterized circularly permuted ATP-grasp superfamily protein